MSTKLSPLQVLQLYPAHDYTLPQYLRSRCSVRGDAPFLLLEEGRQWSWNAFAADVERLAAVLEQRGVQAGHRVGIIARNDVAHALLLFACATLGATMVPLNPELTPAELAVMLRRCKAVGLVLDPDVREAMQAAVAREALSPWLLLTRADDGVQIASLEQAMANAPAGSREPRHAPRPEDVCVIIFTSGSTGTPKGVLHTQRNWLLSAEAYLSRTHLQPGGRLMILMPMFHINSVFYSLGGTVAAGASALIARRFSATTFWDTVERHGITQMNLVDTIANILQARPRSEYRPGHQLRTVAGGIRPGNMRCLQEEFGIRNLITGYGMSEIPGVISNSPDIPYVPGSMGVLGRHPDPDREWSAVKIVDEQGRPVPQHTPGELLVRTPNCFIGYMDEPELTARSFVDGWFRTEDLVRQDEQGNFFFVGRKRDILRRRGENISGVEIDLVAQACPLVSLAACIGVPAELGDEEILLAAVPRPGSTLTPQAMREWCAERLAPIKVPRFIVIVEDLPRTGPYKVGKETMRRNAAALRADAVDFAPLPTRQATA